MSKSDSFYLPFTGVNKNSTGRFSKYLTIYFVLHFSNEYINKVFAGAWFRSNFEDLLSYRGANKLEWFEVLLGADCSPVPATGKSQFFSNFLTGKTDDH